MESLPKENQGFLFDVDLPRVDPFKAQATKLGYVGKKPTDDSRDSDAWFTPAAYVEAAREALGGRIDLDPFSSAEANKIVRAERYFTVDDDALLQDWSSPSQRASQTVWMNPPYSGALCILAINKFTSEFERGAFAEGIVLVNNATETKWFQYMLKSASAVCFTDHRIAFWNSDGKAVSGNTRGQSFLYFGPEVERFGAAFAEIGFVTRIQPVT